MLYISSGRVNIAVKGPCFLAQRAAKTRKKLVSTGTIHTLQETAAIGLTNAIGRFGQLQK